MSEQPEELFIDRAASDDAAREDPRATLDAWRKARADRIDPLRFAMIDALARRVATLPPEGEARRLLDERLTELIAGYSRDVGEHVERQRDETQARSSQSHAEPASAHRHTSLATLAASLTDRSDRIDTLADTLQYFHAMWSKLSAGRQLRQSLAQVPGNAGPLNSSRLVHRALSLMNELSPEYLQHFLLYVETLSALGELGALIQPPRAQQAAPGAPGADNASRAKNAKCAKPATTIKRKTKGS